MSIIRPLPLPLTPHEAPYDKLEAEVCMSMSGWEQLS